MQNRTRESQKGFGGLMNMTTTTQAITIKGTKEGLQFRISNDVTFVDVMSDLEHKIQGSHNLLHGPLTHVSLHLGTLYVSEDRQKQLVQLIESAGNLLVKHVYSDVITIDEAKQHVRMHLPKFEVATVRSGQVIESEQDIVVLGDVNPGGWVISHGNIFVLGVLKGNAHAGYEGEHSKVIAAAALDPIQLRIADVIEATFDALHEEGSLMKAAYLDGDRMQFTSVQSLANIRPNIAEYNF